MVAYEYNTSPSKLFYYYLFFEVVLFGRVIRQFHTEINLVDEQNSIRDFRAGWDSLIKNKDDVSCIPLTSVPYKEKDVGRDV